ncbi:unnamed protein product [Heterobilharzia americana]|nr:unnamed protein product [Heterobilharzia americana]
MAENTSWSFDEADLSACFDDTMNGIGAGVSSMFNMRDALSALPLCSEEGKLTDDSKPEDGSKFSILSSNSVQNVDIFVSTADTNSHLFDNILKAPTSSVTRLSEASLTYLNQGQTYELKLDAKTSEIMFIKTCVRVTFYDKQMELKEREYWNDWHQTHPSEHLLDIDYEKSNDYEELVLGNTSSDVLLCVWKYPTCTVGLRFNCVSTEFTAKKHGGEKGIPFKFQVDHFEYDTSRHLESYACQIKVFKMKGADRKHRTDREKIGRKSNHDQAIYKPSLPVTKLSFLPTKQVKLHDRNHYHCQSVSDKEFGGNTLKESVTKALNTSPTTSVPSNSAKQLRIDVNDIMIQNSFPKKQTAMENFTLEDVNDATHNFKLPHPVGSSRNDRMLPDFVTPVQPFRRTAYLMLRNSSPGISPSPSSNGRPNCIIQPCLQRRRRLRVGDCCVGACSYCGRSCRSASRWVRSNKNRIMCSAWDNSVGRVKQANLIFEKRRAVHSYDSTSNLPELQKSKAIRMKIPFQHSNSDAMSNSKIYELSTSGESSSLGNDEFSKWTIVDKYDDKSCSSSIIVSNLPLNSMQQIDQDPLLGMSSATPASRDAGYCSDIHTSPGRNVAERVLDQIGYCTEDDNHDRDDDDDNGDGDSLKYEELCLEKPDPVVSHQNSLCDSIVQLVNVQQTRASPLTIVNESLSPCPSINSTIGNMPSVHSEMTASQVSSWLCQSHFENLVETFKNFTGRDMLRLAKEDLLSICGSLEGLRLYNSLYSRPSVPRCILYVCLKGETIYHAVMLYEMNVHELHCRIAGILSCRQDHIKIICLITENDIPVLLTDELIVQLKDKSTYQITVNRTCSNKVTVWLKPV